MIFWGDLGEIFEPENVGEAEEGEPSGDDHKPLAGIGGPVQIWLCWWWPRLQKNLWTCDGGKRYATKDNENNNKNKNVSNMDNDSDFATCDSWQINQIITLKKGALGSVMETLPVRWLVLGDTTFKHSDVKTVQRNVVAVPGLNLPHLVQQVAWSSLTIICCQHGHCSTMPWSSCSCATESGLPPTTTNSHIQSYPMCF